ncbi:hypothetical protein HZB60_06660 [candidate division KSB1 bacterium]|nr:hypothetical protein [candidate division KSB1 bacterium]
MSRLFRIVLVAVAGFLVLRYVARLLSRPAQPGGDPRVKGQPRSGGASVPADQIKDAEFKDLPRQ